MLCFLSITAWFVDRRGPVRVAPYTGFPAHLEIIVGRERPEAESGREGPA